MNSKGKISLLFWIGAAYDGILGIAFFLAPGAIFSYMQVTPPNHFGYARFPAALLVVFALMFVAIARKPVENRNLIPYGIGLKASYCLVTLYYWFAGSLPGMWKPFTLFDLVFAVLFYWAYVSLRQTSGEASGVRDAPA